MELETTEIKIDDDYFLNAIDNKIQLSQEHLKELVYCWDVDETTTGEGRWHKSVETIVKLNDCKKDRYFAVQWRRGLTEYQEDEYPNQPYEVEKYSYEKTIKVIEWREI